MTYLIEVGDTHINGTTSLCIPEFRLDDGGLYSASRDQVELWEFWLDFWDRVDGLPDKDADKIVCFKGDLGELDAKRRTNQLITGNKASIVRLAQLTISPAIPLATKILFIRGTPAHEGKSCWLEELVASQCDKTVRELSSGRYSWYHAQITIEQTHGTSLTMQV